jgi:TPP-dependent pyruvate/acetoin dehydrogenase alpha subunit
MSEGVIAAMATQTAGPAAAGDPVAVSAESAPSAHLTAADRTELLRAMLLMRAIEARALTLYRQGRVPGSFYDGFGQEAVSVGAAFAMAPQDRLCILHRDLGAHLVRGVEPPRILAQYMGRASGVTGGRDGNVHFGDPALGCVGMVSMLPDMMCVATGMAMAFKLRGEPRVALTFFGDGSTSRGDFHEAMNWAGVQRLPVVFVLENNQYAYSTPLEKQFAVAPVERARVYGFPGVTVDGNDAEAVFVAVRVARERALAGDGPTLVEVVTMRMHGHAAHDDMRYVPPELLAAWAERDPIELQERRVAGLGVDVDALRAEVDAEVEAAVAEALAAPMPDPADAVRGVFAVGEPQPLGDGRAPWSGFATGADALGDAAAAPAPNGNGPRATKANA